jgi:hypothetical protein
MIIHQINPSARYLSSLNELALAQKRRQQIDQNRRQIVTIQKYDWNLVKKLSQEPQFHLYIEKLKTLG